MVFFQTQSKSDVFPYNVPVRRLYWFRRLYWSVFCTGSTFVSVRSLSESDVCTSPICVSPTFVLEFPEELTCGVRISCVKETLDKFTEINTFWVRNTTQSSTFMIRLRFQVYCCKSGNLCHFNSYFYKKSLAHSKSLYHILYFYLKQQENHEISRKLIIQFLTEYEERGWGGYALKNWVFATNSDFRIPISLQPNVV